MIGLYLIFITLLMTAMSAHGLTDEEARKQLLDAGIKVNEEPPVSFENIQQAAIDGIIFFKQQSNCDITIIGGTEEVSSAHPGVENFFNLRTKTSTCIDKFITRGGSCELVDKEGPVFRGPAPANYILKRQNHTWLMNFEHN